MINDNLMVNLFAIAIVSTIYWGCGYLIDMKLAQLKREINSLKNLVVVYEAIKQSILKLTQHEVKMNVYNVNMQNINFDSETHTISVVALNEKAALTAIKDLYPEKDVINIVFNGTVESAVVKQ